MAQPAARSGSARHQAPSSRAGQPRRRSEHSRRRSPPAVRTPNSGSSSHRARPPRRSTCSPPLKARSISSASTPTSGARSSTCPPSVRRRNLTLSASGPKFVLGDSESFDGWGLHGLEGFESGRSLRHRRPHDAGAPRCSHRQPVRTGRCKVTQTAGSTAVPLRPPRCQRRPSDRRP